MRKSSFNEPSDDGAEEDEDEVEQRRREYLRRHREMLLQKQRLETVPSPALLLSLLRLTHRTVV